MRVALSWHRPGHRGTAASPSQTGGRSSLRCQHVGRLDIQQGDGEGVPLESLELGMLPFSVRLAVSLSAARCSDTADAVACSALWRPCWGGRGEGTEGARLVEGERERRGSKLKTSELAASREPLTLSRIKNWMLFKPRGPYTTSTLEYLRPHCCFGIGYYYLGPNYSRTNSSYYLTFGGLGEHRHAIALLFLATRVLERCMSYQASYESNFQEFRRRLRVKKVRKYCNFLPRTRISASTHLNLLTVRWVQCP